MKTYFEWYDKHLWRVVYGAIVQPEYLYLDFGRCIKSGTISKYWRVSPFYELEKYAYVTLDDQHRSLQFFMGDDYKLNIDELSFASDLIKRLSFQGYNPSIIVPVNDKDTVYNHG